MLNSRHVLGGVVITNKGQANVNDLLPTITGFRHRVKERPTNLPLEAVVSFESHHQWADIRRLRDPFDAVEANHHQMYSHFCAAPDILESEEKKFRALLANYYHLINCRRRRASSIRKERKPKLVRAFDFCAAFYCHRRWHDEDEDHILVS